MYIYAHVVYMQLVKGLPQLLQPQLAVRGERERVHAARALGRERHGEAALPPAAGRLAAEAGHRGQRAQGAALRTGEGGREHQPLVALVRRRHRAPHAVPREGGAGGVRRGTPTERRREAQACSQSSVYRTVRNKLQSQLQM